MSSTSFAASSGQQQSGRTTQAPRRAIPVPQNPVEEEFSPRIEACHVNYETLVVPHNSLDPVPRSLDLLKREDPSQAYMYIESKPPKSLNHHAPGWGDVFFGIILPMIEAGVFKEPTPDEAEYVAIKRLCKAVVNDSIAQGRRENPYKELHRMQTIGDNIHILGCIEALEDDRYLYIVMPYCEHETLVELIPWQRGLSEMQAQVLFLQLLQNIAYLKAHGICHRDLSPDNCMIYKGRLVLADLAMSFRIPPTGVTTPLGGFGKPAYLPPEVFFNLPFDANCCDLWSSAVILFNLLTGEIMYEIPRPDETMFRYFILARGVSRSPVNERTVEVLMDLDEGERLDVWRVASKCMSLSPESLELLGGMLNVNPQERWGPDQIAACAWFRGS